jgi:hypothetical protein
MFTVIAAPIGWMILTHTRATDTTPGFTTRTPVVAFAHVQGTLMYPLTAVPFAGLTRGVALLAPTGEVLDPSTGLVGDSVDEWLKLCANDNYWKRPDLSPKKPDLGAHVSAVFNASGADAEAIRRHLTAQDDHIRALEPGRQISTAPENRRDPNSKGDPSIHELPEWPEPARAPFKSKSFWMHAGLRQIRVIEAGEKVLKESEEVTKISRDHYVRLRNEGWPIFSANAAAELPFNTDAVNDAGEPTGEEDEDDGADLI